MTRKKNNILKPYGDLYSTVRDHSWIIEKRSRNRHMCGIGTLWFKPDKIRSDKLILDDDPI